MTKAEARKLPPGCYFLYWKTGGSSMAAVGTLYDGRRWFAPVDWISDSAIGIASTKWRMVAYVITITVGKRSLCDKRMQAIGGSDGADSHTSTD